MTGAKLIQESDNPKLFGLIQEITIASGLPMPKVAIVIDSAPNAFATGRNQDHALIAFTTGILDVMDRDQLQGVIAHELAHVANRDTLVSAVPATTENKVAFSRQFYNDNVRELNTAVKTVPTNFFAGFAKVTEREFYEVEDPQDRKAPNVKF